MAPCKGIPLFAKPLLSTSINWQAKNSWGFIWKMGGNVKSDLYAFWMEFRGILFWSIFLLMCPCQMFYAPWSNDRGYIVVCLSVVNFNLYENFWTVKDREFIFGMHTPLRMHSQMTPRSVTWTFTLKIAILDFVATRGIVVHKYILFNLGNNFGIIQNAHFMVGMFWPLIIYLTNLIGFRTSNPVMLTVTLIVCKACAPFSPIMYTAGLRVTLTTDLTSNRDYIYLHKKVTHWCDAVYTRWLIKKFWN